MKKKPLTPPAHASAPAVPFWHKYMPLLLAALAFLLYANTIGNGYNMDDELVTHKHKLTSKGISAIPEIFTSPYYSDDMGYRYGYRPVVLVSFAVEHSLFGDKPGVSHFWNVVLFAVTVLVLFRFLNRLLGEDRYGITVLAVLLFAVHPIHTEVVAGIKNRDEILALLFGLLAGNHFLKSTGKKAWIHLLAVFLFFSLGMLSKKSIFPLALVFPVIAVWLKPGTDPKKYLYGALPMLVPAAVVGADAVPGRSLYLFGLLLAGLFGVWLLVEGRRYFARAFTVILKYKALLGATVCIALGGVFFVLFFGDRASFGWMYAGYVCWMLAGLYFLPVTAPYLFLALGGIAFLSDALWAIWMPAAFFAYRLSDVSQPRKTLLINLVFFLVILGLGTVTRNSHFYWGRALSMLILLGLLVLLRKKMWIGIGVTVVVAVVSYVVVGHLLNEHFVWIVFLSLFLAKLKYGETLTRYRLEELLPMLVMASLLSVFTYLRPDDPGTVAPATVQAAPASVYVPKADSIQTTLPMEGRKLEVAENILMAPHTTEEKYAVVLLTLGEYARLHLFPYHLSFYYGYAELDLADFSDPYVLLSLTFYLLLVVLAVVAWIKRNVLPAAGIFWYFAGIFLFSNAGTLVAGMVGERLAFTASVGFCILLASLVFWLRPRLNFKKPAAAEIVLGVLLLAFGFRTLLRNTDWKDKLTLMGNDIEHLDNSAQAHNLYALSLMQESFENKKLRPDQQYNMRKLALTHFERALEIWPNFFNAAFDKGRVGVLTGDLPKAIEGFEAAVRIGPAPGFMEPYYQLTELYFKTGRYPEYLMNARRLFALEHNRAEPYNLMAKAHFLNGQADSAKTYLRRGMEAFPADQSLRKNLAEVFKNQGMADSAAYYGGQ